MGWIDQRSFIDVNRISKRVCIPFTGAAVINATAYMDVCTVPKDGRVLYCAVGIETAAANGAGTMTYTLETDEGSPTILVGSGGAINAKATGYTSIDNALTGRKVMPADQKLRLKLVTSNNAITQQPVGFLEIELVRQSVPS